MTLRHRLISPSLFRYVLSEYLLSFLVAFSLFFVIFLINQLIVITVQFISQEVDTGKALLLLVYSLPAVVVISFPFGSLVAAFLITGRLNADNEFMAIQSIGYGLRQVFLPVLSAAAMLSFIAFLIGNIILPLGTIQYRSLLEELIYSNTELILKPYSVTQFNKTAIITDDVRAGNLASILLFDSSETGRRRIIAAGKANLDKSLKDTGVLKLQLDDVTIVEFENAYNDTNRSDLSSLDYTLSIRDLSRDIRNPTPSEMSFIDIFARITQLYSDLNLRREQNRNRFQLESQRLQQNYAQFLQSGDGGYNELMAIRQNMQKISLEVINDRNLQNHWIEFWKKLTIPLACIALVVLAFPLGLYTRKSARGIGLGIGLVLAGFFWGSILLGQFVSMQYLDLNAALIMWAPNLLFVVLGIIAFIPLVRR